MASIIKVSQNQWLQSRRNRKLLLIIGIIVIFALLAAGAYVVYRYNQDQTDKRTQDAKNIMDANHAKEYNELRDISKVTTSAQTKSLKGDIEGAKKEILTEIENPKSSQQTRVILYQMLAYILSNATRYDEAMVYAQKSEEIVKDRKSAKVIAQIAEAKKDKPLATQWYQTAIDRFSVEDKAQFPELVEEYKQALAEAKK